MLRIWNTTLFVLVFLANSAVAETITFTHQPTQRGDEIWQHVTVFANTMTTYAQQGNTISRRQIYLTREQIRRVEVLDPRPGPQNVVRVTYDKAQETRTLAGQKPEHEPQVVSGKSYVVRRTKDQIEVKDPQGVPVSEQEAAIVRENMQSVGRPNPLAQFLNGRTVTIGEKIALPPELAERMLGWKANYGSIERVSLTLLKVSPLGVATFASEMVGKPQPDQVQSTKLRGQFDIQANTCRTSSTQLVADLATHETRGPVGHTFTVSHQGKANIHTHARYRTQQTATAPASDGNPNRSVKR